LITEEEDKVEFSVEGVDYMCYYTSEIVQSAYPISHNSITNRINYAVDEFIYNKMIKKTLVRVDGKDIEDKEDICDHIELNMNAK
jgi:hypothetical protein